MNHEIQSDIKHNARKENVFAYLNDSGRHPLFSVEAETRWSRACVFQIQSDNNQQVIDEDLIYSSFDDRLDDAKSSAAEKYVLVGALIQILPRQLNQRNRRKIVPTLVSSSGTTHTTQLPVATKKKIEKDKSSRSRTRGLAGVIERIEQREAEFSSQFVYCQIRRTKIMFIAIASKRTGKMSVTTSVKILER